MDKNKKKYTVEQEQIARFAKVLSLSLIHILVDDLPDDAQGGFPKCKERREKTQRYNSNVRHQLADKAVYDVWYCMALLLCNFQGSYT